MTTLTMTRAEIEAAPPPLLRRRLREMGHDPTSAQFGGGLETKMRSFLLKEVEKKKPPSLKPAKPVAVKPSHLEVVVVSDRKGSSKAPPPRESKIPAVAKKEGELGNDLLEQILAKVSSVEQSFGTFKEEMVLRIRTLELHSGISHASIETPSELDEWVFEDPDTKEKICGVNEVAIQAMYEPALRKLAAIMQVEIPAGADVREMKRILTEGLSIYEVTEVDGEDRSVIPLAEEQEEEIVVEKKAPPKKVAAPAVPPARKSTTKYKKGDVVRAKWEGVVYDPCSVEEVPAAKRGVQSYALYFAQDDSSGEVEESDIVGLSKKSMPVEDDEEDEAEDEDNDE